MAKLDPEKINHPLSLNSYFMEIAKIAKLRGTCKRRQVGAVFVLDSRIISTGYNGSPAGAPHCIDFGCAMEGSGHCRRTVHAEINGIINAAFHGQKLQGSTLYSTAFPCLQCAMALRNAGVKKVFYLEDYPYTKEENKLFLGFSSHIEWVKY